MVRSSWSAVLVALAQLFLAGAAVAADSVTVGTATANGPTVDVPVSIRDGSGTPLGMDHPPPARIQAFSIRVNYSPASAVSSVTFTRAGITSSLQPAFETSPASSGSISLLASFQQSSNPIPFTLDASAPGNQVAHLVFTLSSSATPGTTITLTLDGSTTQLTDEGGSAATKETSGNGTLALVNGSISIPVPALTLTPSPVNVQAGSSESISASTDVRLVSNTTVSLTSSNPSVASVPASVTIQAGNRAAGFAVSGVSPGTATITATLPASAGGGTATATVTVTAAPQCSTPAVPQVTAPPSALAGATYTITWLSIAAATDYVIDESTDAGFTNPASQTAASTSAAYSHSTADARYYYRVRARNRAGSCNLTSASSAAVSVLITSVPLPATVRVLPVVSSAPGANGSYFKTSLQLYNPRTVAAFGEIRFHPQGEPGSPSDPSLAYNIPPGKTLSFADLLPAMGLTGGVGTADIIADPASPFPVTLARIFNDGGIAGTTGLALEAMAPEDALASGSTGVLIAPADMQKFRLNIGVRTFESGAVMNVTVRDREGLVLKTVPQSFPATYFKQNTSLEFLDGFVLTGGETISLEITSGSAFVYGATTDSVTSDPSVQFARRVQ